MNSTEKAFSEAIASYIKDDSKVLVAFSGGCDSLALLLLCSKVLGAERTAAVYVNHNIRPRAELESEMSLNRSNCSSIGIELVIRTIDEGKVRLLADARKGGIEDAARVIRYEILEEERARLGCSLILTAHHRQDQIETIIMNLQKGSPITSLKGISTYDESRHLLRPLLGFSRSDLEKYLSSNNLDWSCDSTNQDQDFRRNAVRHDTIPSVRLVWPEFEDVILDLGRQAEKACEDALGAEGVFSCQEIDLPKLKALDLPKRTVALFCMWDSLFGGKSMPMTLLDRVLDAISEGTDCNVGSNMAIFSIYRGKVYLTDPSEDRPFADFEMPFDPSASLNLVLPGKMRLFSGSEASAYVDGHGLDESLALHIDPLRFGVNPRLRFARTGDGIRLKSGFRMVMRLLQDMKVPPQLRCRVPVLVDDDGICAVFGSVYGGKDRICVKFRTSIARNSFPLYIVSKG